jgi:predicted ATPase/DNA-binding SARP family transcriptional activator
MSGDCHIEMLGQLRLRRGDAVPLPLQRQKATALLAYLAFHSRHPHPREVLIELLWPEEDPEESRPKLRSQIYILRELLASLERPADSLLVAGRTTVHLDPDAFTTDVAQFQAALRSAARAVDPTERAGWLETAVTLYGGELLPGHYEEWVLTERQALAEQYLGALRQRVEAREEAGDLEGALAAARQAVSGDPLQEEAHYTVMRLSAALGQPSAALRQYQELERLLREGLDETPSAETRALAEELRRGDRILVVARRPTNDQRRTTNDQRQADLGLPATPEAQRVSPPPRAPDGSQAISDDPGTLVVRRSSLVAKLPTQLTRFFGREEELARLTELLSSAVTRLVTITGPGGSGKTRLAIAAAGRLREKFGDAIAFVPLADLTDAARIPDAAAGALGLDRPADVEPMEQVIEHLSAQPWLLVLDNYEHLVDEGALLVRQLLERVPTLACLVTSRQRLGLSGEQEFALLPLPTPRRSARLEQIQEYASVQLFVDRARSTRGDFSLTEGNAPAVAELCDRLEGLPLALELAAARAAVLSPMDMLGQLERRFAFLVTRQRDTPARHRTLLATIESSYQLLDADLQRFFARLSVFRGGWTLEAAHAVCTETVHRCQLRVDRKDGASSSLSTVNCQLSTTLDRLEQLRDWSLLTVEETEGEGRYRLLDTLREYAWEQLEASGEQAEIRKRHWEWCLALAERARAAANLPEQGEWLLRQERELDNLRAALRACHESADRRGDRAAAEAGLRLANALGWFWGCRGYLAEGLDALETAMADGADLPAAMRAPALASAANIASIQGARSRAEALRQQSRHVNETALQAIREEGNRQKIAGTLLSLVATCFWLGDLDAAWTYGLEARQLMEELGDLVGLAAVLEVITGLPLRRGDFRTARTLLEERLTICRKLGRSTLLIHALGGMGHLERDEGNYARARAFYQESLVLRRELGVQFAVAQSLEDLAALAGMEQQFERAIRLLGAQDSCCETLGARPPVADAANYERTLAEGRVTLGEAAFAAAWATGRSMSLEQAVDFAMGETPPSSDDGG